MRMGSIGRSVDPNEHVLAPDDRSNANDFAEEMSGNTLEIQADAAIVNGLARHSPDFSSIWLFGKYYEFTPLQAAIVAILWDAWRQGTPGVSQPHLLRKSGAPVTGRLADIFRSSTAWGEAILCSRRNVYRLEVAFRPRSGVSERSDRFGRSRRGAHR
jgi:hypothetical protein